MRLAVVIPSDNLKHGESLLENLVPAIKDQRSTGEDPVLAVGDFGTEMRKEPRRHGCHVLLVTEPALVRVVSVCNGDGVAIGWSLVVAVVVPSLEIEIVSNINKSFMM